MEEKNEVSEYDRLKIWLKENFSKKNNITRLYMFLLAFFLVIPVSIGMNLYAQNVPQQAIGNNSFITIYVTTNPGISFSMMENAPSWSIYLIQWLISIVVGLIALSCKKWYYVLFWSFAFLGGVFNVIDRACAKVVVSYGSQIYYNVVMDYFKFEFMSWGVFNFPDVYVCVGTFGGVLLYIIFTIINIFKNDNKDK